MHYKTEKTYYISPYLKKISTRWRKISPTLIAVERSVAFPEGGGQRGDHGVIIQNQSQIAFYDTQKVLGNGRTIIDELFPVINVEGEIQLYLSEPLDDSWNENEEIVIEIDFARRANLTRSHTAAHLVVVAMKNFIPDIENKIMGCSIDIDGGRFDFVIEKMDSTFLSDLQEILDSLTKSDFPVTFSTYNGEEECRIWEFTGVKIPCGGTHLEQMEHLGSVILKKKNKGKGYQRLCYELKDPSSLELLNRYHY